MQGYRLYEAKASVHAVCSQGNDDSTCMCVSVYACVRERDGCAFDCAL